MAWTRMIPEGEASGRLKELYDKVEGPWGGVDNILKIQDINQVTGYYAFVNHLADGLGVELEAIHRAPRRRSRDDRSGTGL